METKLLSAVLFFLHLYLVNAAPKYDVKLSDVYFEGGFVYFPVKKARLQERLNEINRKFENEDDHLFIPREHNFKHPVADDEHVIMLGYGSMDAVAFDEALTEEQLQTESTFIEFINVAIPYLTALNGTKVTLQMDLFVKEADPSIEANVILPTPEVADSLVRCGGEDHTFVSFKKGDYSLKMLETHGVPCVTHCGDAIGDNEEYERELQISLTGPDFSICDQFPDLQVDLCDVYRNPLYKSVIGKEDTNVCQYWVPTPNTETCESSFKVIEMSKCLKEYLLIEGEPTPLEGLSQTGTFDIRFVFPCME